MIDLKKAGSNSYLEPIICDVRSPIKYKIWDQPYQPQMGDVTLGIAGSNGIKKFIIAAAIYQKIELPYRFTLTAGEIIYENKHIKTVNLAGFFLSGIDVSNMQSQHSRWETQAPPETFLDGDEIVMSEEFSRQCYFVIHKLGKAFHAKWNLKENFDICRNPQNYSGIQRQIIDLT